VSEFDLTESLVREYLRDHAGEARCADCVARALGPDVSGVAVSAAMTELAGRRPPFAPGRCGCGAGGLMFGRPADPVPRS
jgi:hypothetical protein